MDYYGFGADPFDFCMDSEGPNEIYDFEKVSYGFGRDSIGAGAESLCLLCRVRFGFDADSNEFVWFH